MEPPFSTGHVTPGAANEKTTQLNLCLLLLLNSAMIDAQAPEIWAPATSTATLWGSRPTPTRPRTSGHVFTMTGANSQTNGASLEDCHANFFSLVRLDLFDSKVIMGNRKLGFDGQKWSETKCRPRVRVHPEPRTEVSGVWKSSETGKPFDLSWSSCTQTRFVTF